MKLTFTKLFTTNGPVVDAGAVIIANDQQTRKIEGRVGGPMEDGYFVATLRRGDEPVTITVLQPNTTIEVRMTED